MPEELAQQMPVLKELLTDLGFVQVSKAGWEADDILGCLLYTSHRAGGLLAVAGDERNGIALIDQLDCALPVSYTHLDVYKRQA